MDEKDGCPMKRSREEEEEEEKAEEEEGLVALVKKRQSDVKQLEDRISILTNDVGLCALNGWIEKVFYCLEI